MVVQQQAVRDLGAFFGITVEPPALNLLWIVLYGRWLYGM